MRRFSFPLLAGALIFALAPLARSAALETVSLGGVAATYQGADALTSAVATVNDGGEIQILEAGTYNAVDLVGNKSYEINGTVDGVIVQGSGRPAMTAIATTDTIDVVITRMDIINTSGSASASLRPAFYAVQGTTNTVLNLEFSDVNVRQTQETDGVTVNAGGEALYIADNDGIDSAINLTATSCTFETKWLPVTGNDNLHAVRLEADGVTTKTFTFNDVTALSQSGNALAWETRDNSIYRGSNCIFQTTRPNRSVFRNSGRDYDNSLVEFTDSQFLGAGGEAFITHRNNTNCDNNTYRFDRCTFDSRRFDAVDGTRLIFIRVGGTGNTSQFHNCIFLASRDGSGDQMFYTQTGLVPTDIFNCTFFNTVTPATARGFQADNGDRTQNRVYNTIFSNIADPLNSSGWQAAGNVATVDDSDLGPDRIVTTVGTLNLDSNFVPQAGSPAIDAALSSGTILAAIDYVDRNNTFRGSVHSYDIGAFETNPQTVSPITVSQGGVVADIEHVDGIEMASANIPGPGLIQVIEAGTYGQFDVYGGKEYTIEATVNGVISQGEVDVVDDAGPADITLRKLTIAGKIDNNSDTNVNQQNWLIEGCTIVNNNTRGFEVDQAATSCTFIIRDTVIDVEEECVWHHKDGSGEPDQGNDWVFDRCTFNNSRYLTDSRRVIRIGYQDGRPTQSTMDIFNSVFIVQQGGNTNARGIYITNGNWAARFYNNTIVGSGTGSGFAIWQSISPGTWEVRNNLMLNFLNSSGPVQGTPTAKSNNMIVGPIDEDDNGGGADRIFVNATAGLSNALTAANVTEVIDPLNPLRIEYIPQTTSPTSQAVDAGTSATLAAIGYVDRRGHLRYGPQAPADIGAFETDKGGVPVELSSFKIE